MKDTLPAEFTPQFLDYLDGRTRAAQALKTRLAEIQADLPSHLFPYLSLVHALHATTFVFPYAYSCCFLYAREK